MALFKDMSLNDTSFIFDYTTFDGLKYTVEAGGPDDIWVFYNAEILPWREVEDVDRVEIRKIVEKHYFYEDSIDQRRSKR